MKRWLLITLLVVTVLSANTPAVADEPGSYEKYLVNVICAKTRCVQNPSTELPPGTLEYLETIWSPIFRSSRIPAGEPIRLVLTYAREPNAWALKHYWGITVGLWNMGLTRDELAFVVAHEFGHIELGHYQKKLNEAAKIYAVAAIAIILSQGNYNPLNDPYFNLAVKLAMAGYSRQQETEADLRAIQTIQPAGFDERASLTLLQRFGSLGVSGTGDLFDDHPSIVQRIARIQRELPPRPALTPEPAPSVVPSQSPGSAPSPAPVVTPLPPSTPPEAPSPSPVTTPGLQPPFAKPTVRVPRVQVTRVIIEREEIGSVLIGDRIVMRIRTSYDGLNPFERADLVAEKLNRLLAAGLTSTEVSAEVQAGRSVILARGEVILTIDTELARKNGTNPANLALLWAREIQAAIAALN
jgi:hypothetical protein